MTKSEREALLWFTESKGYRLALSVPPTYSFEDKETGEEVSHHINSLQVWHEEEMS